VETGRFRRVTPSPRPLGILEEAAINALLAHGVVVIACGGGGIPVAWEGDRLVGVEAVIDKDLASSLLARRVQAQKLVILTSVEQAAVRYCCADERRLGVIGVDEARNYLAAGEFAPGSMGPKVEAAIDFLEHGGEECIITSTESVGRALNGEAGTHIVASAVAA